MKRSAEASQESINAGKISAGGASAPNGPDLIYLDPVLIDIELANRGLSLKQFAANTNLAFNTLRGLHRQQGLHPQSARKIAESLQRQVSDLLAPWDRRYQPPLRAQSPALGVSEWETTGFIGPGIRTTNGLYFVPCRLRHRHTAQRFGRGKFYHLHWVREGLTADLRDKLSRHADVCARIKRHPHVVWNISSAPTSGQDDWWVVDEWVGAETLEDRLTKVGGPPEPSARLLLEIAEGLAALHAAGVIFRELAPSRVLMSESDGRAVLTDFELAKLLNGVPSVAGDWPDDPYRAPELDGGVTTVAADIYSFGRLAATVFAGEVPDPGQEAEIFGAAKLPKRLQKLLVHSVEPFPTKRLGELPPLIKELRRWAGT
jgi:serine/threonine protein kinase